MEDLQVLIVAGSNTHVLSHNMYPVVDGRENITPLTAEFEPVFKYH